MPGRPSLEEMQRCSLQSTDRRNIRGGVMPAYLIHARKQITDAKLSQEYSRLVVPQIQAFGGEVVASRGAVHVLDGEWHPQSVTILRFDDLESLMRYYHSPEYAPLKQMRLESSVGDLIAVDVS
jgi:uncharacterized protein (DUF1330 family)